ncbi:MAG: flippase-like domain-containing protein [Oscillospiraceae bacterium]|nr:flippase-like domain-containing protein [Oscillospiraceae bacterium]
MKDKKSAANRIFSVVGLAIGAVIIIGLVLYVRETVDFEELLVVLRPDWLIAGALCVPISQSVDAFNFYFLGWRTKSKVRLSACFDIAFIGEFFYKLGPIGAPAQLKLMYDAGFPGTKTASVFVWKMVANMLVYMVYALLALIVKTLIYHEPIGAGTVLGVALLIALYVVVIAFALFCAVRPEPVQRFARWLLTKLSKKIKALQKPGRIDRLMGRLEEICDQLNAYRGDRVMLGGLFFGMFIQLGVLYCIPVCVYYGLGLSGQSVTALILTQSLVMIISRIVVLPGNAGGAEGSFFLFMAPVFGPLISVGMVLWRLMSFVETIAIGAVWLVIRFIMRALRGRRGE